MSKNEDKTSRIIEDLEIKNEIVDLEKFYVNGQVSILPELVEKEKERIINEIYNYKLLHTENKYDKKGNLVSTKIKTPPFVISNYFFRSITNLHNIEPQYSGEHLSILWNLYTEIVMQVNFELCVFTPTLSHFCKFIGMTTAGFKMMKDSPDDGIRSAVAKILDTLYDGSVLMAELGKHNVRATTYRMKSELDRVEKSAPQVTVNAVTVNLDDIQKRIDEVNNRNCFK